jgi:mannose-1-phosphate guanylyltransferase / mannose-6-phosphate isomerase
MTNTIFPVILCGGSGTRLWPLSRSMFPKQFIEFFEDKHESLFASTALRLPAGGGFEPPTLLSNCDHRFLLQDELSKAHVEPREILLEPVARNTAPAIVLAALSIAQQQPDAIMAVMPADHLIGNPEQFAAAVRQAAAIASEGRLVLFGIKPDSPHTGYGYILQGGALGSAGGAFQVEAFVEKPDLATAERYCADGRYFWNSGIFVLHARTFLAEIERHAPEILEHAGAALRASETDLGCRRADAAHYALCPNISIDYAVMEKTSLAAMLPLAVGWNDVGSWSSLWDVSRHDASGNAVRGDVILLDTHNSYIHSERGLISAIGVENLVIVDTPDATLVAARDRVQDVSKIVNQLKASNRREQQQHLRNQRPWGHFETLSHGARFQVKLLHVKPLAKLSMQMHHHRSEHWTVVSGTAKVTCNGKEMLAGENESVYISAGHWHRLENPGKIPLEVIEVQIGSYLGEDDIIRGDDVYHRAPDETR